MFNHGIIIYGPAGCGKTRNSKLIAKAYGKDTIIDEYRGGHLCDNSIAFSNIHHSDEISFSTAIAHTISVSDVTVTLSNKGEII